jgi:hypothetical protein
MKHWHTVGQVQTELDQIRLEMLNAERTEKERVYTEIRVNLQTEHRYLKRYGKAQPRLSFTEKQTRIAIKHLTALQKTDQ